MTHYCDIKNTNEGIVHTVGLINSYHTVHLVRMRTTHRSELEYCNVSEYKFNDIVSDRDCPH